MRRIAVTGGSGLFGSHVVRLLTKRGYEVKILDVKSIPIHLQALPGIECRQVDLNHYEETASALSGCDAVIHTAASMDVHSRPQLTFATNTVSTFHVLEAASTLGIGKAVIASSESAYGFPWANRPLAPLYLPVDEQHPLMAHDSYGTSKAVNETTAASFHRQTGMQVVSLRLSTLCTSEVYAYLLTCLSTPHVLRRILWSYVDVRDAAEACVLALEQSGLGCVSLNITANETCSDLLTKDLIARQLPEVQDLRKSFIGYEALYSNEKAKRMLGWEPVHGWREQLGNR